MLHLRRREFITLLGGAAACGARAAVGDTGGRVSQRPVANSRFTTSRNVRSAWAIPALVYPSARASSSEQNHFTPCVVLS
jgi:hypothetical protein